MAVIVFDVNETLSDLAPMGQRFADVGADSALARLWFTSVLREGFALAAAGSSQPFAAVAEGVLRTLLAGTDLDRDLDASVDHVLTGFAALSMHPDVPDGVRALHAAGHRLVTLSNGSTGVAEQLLGRAGLRGAFEALLSVDDAGVWKPARGAYSYAAHVCGVDASELTLVAVHPWDIDGAARAGLSTAWVNRGGEPYPEHFTAPTHRLRALTDLSAALAPG